MLLKPYILNIESATEICSVSIGHGSETAALVESTRPNDHSKVITKMIGQCCREAGISAHQLAAIAISAGPGSYTSLRVGVSVAKGLCYSLDLPLLSVGTLPALAMATFQNEREDSAFYCPMLDARRMEVYCGLYDSKGVEVVPPTPKIIDKMSFDEYFSNNKKIIFSGPGSLKTRHLLENAGAFFSPVVCSAIHLQAVSLKNFIENKFENLAYFQPVYLKAPNITEPRHLKIKQGQ